MVPIIIFCFHSYLLPPASAFYVMLQHIVCQKSIGIVFIRTLFFTLFSFLFHSDFIHFDFLLSAHHPGTRISEQSQLLIRWLKSPACGEGNVRGLPPVEGQFQNPYSVFVLMWLRLNRCRHRLCMSSPILQRFPLLLNEFPLLGSNTL